MIWGYHYFRKHPYVFFRWMAFFHAFSIAWRTSGVVVDLWEDSHPGEFVSRFFFLWGGLATYIGVHSRWKKLVLPEMCHHVNIGGGGVCHDFFCPRQILACRLFCLSITCSRLVWWLAQDWRFSTYRHRFQTKKSQIRKSTQPPGWTGVQRFVRFFGGAVFFFFLKVVRCLAIWSDKPDQTLYISQDPSWLQMKIFSVWILGFHVDLYGVFFFLMVLFCYFFFWGG